VLWFLIMLHGRNIHLPRSRTTTPLVLFVLASLLSMVVGNATGSGRTSPRQYPACQLGQWGIFAFSALAFWLMGSLARDEIWLRRLTYFYLAIAGSLAIIRVMPRTARIRDLIATFALDRAPFWLLLAALAGRAVAFKPASFRALAMVSCLRSWELFLAYAFILERKTLSNLAGVAPVLVCWRGYAGLAGDGPISC